MVSLNTYVVTQPALEEIGTGEDGFTYDVTSWLHDGVNTLTGVLIGPPGDVPFRMIIAQGEQPEHTLDEANFLPLATPWRLWTQLIERPASMLRSEIEDCQPLAQPVSDDRIMLRSPSPISLGMPLRIDHIKAPLSLVSIATPSARQLGFNDKGGLSNCLLGRDRFDSDMCCLNATEAISLPAKSSQLEPHPMRPVVDTG